MPRANRHFLRGQLWHITHRCHEKAFLLKFARDRGRYLRWLFEAKKRFGLCVLDSAVTSNHIHLLVKDAGDRAIAQSMQLVAGRMGQEWQLIGSDLRKALVDRCNSLQARHRGGVVLPGRFESQGMEKAGSVGILLEQLLI